MKGDIDVSEFSFGELDDLEVCYTQLISFCVVFVRKFLGLIWILAVSFCISDQSKAP